MKPFIVKTLAVAIIFYILFEITIGSRLDKIQNYFGAFENKQERIKAKEKISKETSANLTTRLKKMILSVDGNSDKAFINNFVDNEFLSRDSYPFRENLSKITPDIDMNVKVKDSNGEDAEVMLPITLRFFWPSSGI